VRNKRLVGILTAAADAMEAGMDPFDTAFLVDNQVSLDESYVMGDLMALGARLIALGLEHPEIARGAVDGAHLASAYGALNDALARWAPLVGQGGGGERA
jgi:hypothetical protein